jgi:hypothetical protein
MASGGKGPGSGRPKGAKDKVPRAKPTQAVTEARLEFEAAIEISKTEIGAEARRYAARSPTGTRCDRCVR